MKIAVQIQLVIENNYLKKVKSVINNYIKKYRFRKFINLLLENIRRSFQRFINNPFKLAVFLSVIEAIKVYLNNPIFDIIIAFIVGWLCFK